MEEVSLQRIRQLLIDIHSVDDAGTLTFNTEKCQQLNYSDAEIDMVNKILAMERIDYLDELFKSKVIFTAVTPNSSPILNVYYFGIAKIIFVINVEWGFYTHVVEEDIDERVANMQELYVQLAYNLANSNNDAYGNPI
jgi:hypothetical protein